MDASKRYGQQLQLDAPGLTAQPPMLSFTALGYTYRTNADASLIEAKDRNGWTRTSSARVHAIALSVLASVHP